MTDTASKISRGLDEKFDIESALKQLGYKSLMDVVRLSREQFIHNHSALLTSNGDGRLYNQAIGRAQQIAFAYRQHRQTMQSEPDCTKALVVLTIEISLGLTGKI